MVVVVVVVRDGHIGLELERIMPAPKNQMHP